MKNNSEYTVHLHQDGVLHSFEPGDEFPSWAAKLVHNPLVTGHKSDSGDAGGGNPAPASDGVPPQAGAGSGRDAWADYAEQHGVDVDEDWKRDQIIDACKKAGVPVE